jgi:hypothetical protein
MNLPKFICVGAQKSGTTSLHDILKQHPDIYLPEIKETKFFHHSKEYSRGLEHYSNCFFSNAKSTQMIGEVDPVYMYDPEVAKRIHTMLGEDIKFIFILRNPALRALSHYHMSRRRGLESFSFEDAILREADRLKTGDFERSNFSYIDRGLYGKQIQCFLKYFPIENLHFIRFEEDFLRNRDITIKKLYSFLNLKNVDFPTSLQSNEGVAPRFGYLNRLLFKDNYLTSMLKYIIPTSSLRLKIAQVIYKYNVKAIKKYKLDKNYTQGVINKYFLKDIKKLEKITALDFSSWYKN